ncbi:platelet-derived growth factor D isoform X3 [Epinephelus lanceolatus]
MSGPVVFQMWMVLLLGTITGVARAQVSTAKVMRGNIRRDDSNHLTTDLYRKEENITVTPVGGAVHSPRYPNAYPRNLLLSWKLLSPPGSRIHLEFDGHFGLEEAENGVCRYDFVEVEDQSETSTIIWGRWCGQKAPPSLNSKTNLLRVTFKSDDYFVAKPGFKVYYSLLYDSPLPASNTNWEAVTMPMSDSVVGQMPATVTQVPFSLEDLDRTIAAFDTVEQLFRSLSPDTWRQDLDSIYTQTHIHYRSRAYHLASRHNKDGDPQQLCCVHSISLQTGAVVGSWCRRGEGRACRLLLTKKDPQSRRPILTYSIAPCIKLSGTALQWTTSMAR